MARKILLADDSVTAQNMGRKILADAGYEVITVNNGSAALKRIAESRPDVIVLDVYMPGYSGLEVCQRLKEAQETSRIPILLTVGKLEPFKPEEAKRARAEAFIVKPFEASELLAALTKLEDKIVPRSEPSKPGRFARANAAIDEGRYDKTMTVEEDSGWKNRIAFPSKKKKAVEESDGDDQAIYNAVNKDLRTTVEHKPEPAAHPTPVEESKVDLGALAPEGLPKDVTPEEIAALAAAAAQVKGKLSDGKWDESTSEPPAVTPVDAKPATADTAEIKASEIPPAAPVGAVAEEKSEAKAEARPAPETAAEVSAPAPVAFGEQSPQASPEHKVETPAEKSPEVSDEVASTVAAPDSVEASSAPVPAAEITGSTESSMLASSAQVVEEPVAMAVAAAAGVSASSRWSAVSVALDPGDNSVSLEEEMQKAHAAFAAAEVAQAGPVTPLPAEVLPIAAEAAPLPTEAFSPVEAVTTELLGSVSAPAPEVEKAGTPEAVAMESVAPVVKEFESVAPREPEPEPVSSTPVSEAAPVEASSSVAQLEAQSPAAEEKTHEALAEEEFSHKASQETEEVPPPVLEEKREDVEESKAHEPAQAVAEVAAPIQEEPETAEEPARGKAEIPAHEASVAVTQLAAGTSDVAKKESDISETTAAAWASWRRIRESGDSRGKSPESSSSSKSEDEPSHDAAAMAAAAGAERTPEDAAKPGEPDDIANIVDGVLADLRPKIVAEISKKLGKKKK